MGTQWLPGSMSMGMYEKISIILRLVVLHVTVERCSGFFVQVGQFASACSMYENFQLKAGLCSWSKAHADLEIQSHFLTELLQAFPSIDYVPFSSLS